MHRSEALKEELSLVLVQIAATLVALGLLAWFVQAYLRRAQETHSKKQEDQLEELERCLREQGNLFQKRTGEARLDFEPMRHAASAYLRCQDAGTTLSMLNTDPDFFPEICEEDVHAHEHNRLLPSDPQLGAPYAREMSLDAPLSAVAQVLDSVPRKQVRQTKHVLEQCAFDIHELRRREAAVAAADMVPANKLKHG